MDDLHEGVLEEFADRSARARALALWRGPLDGFRLGSEKWIRTTPNPTERKDKIMARFEALRQRRKAS